MDSKIYMDGEEFSATDYQQRIEELRNNIQAIRTRRNELEQLKRTLPYRDGHPTKRHRSKRRK